jgi:hypothetical protein
MKHNKLLIVGMLVLPILLSACGGGSSSSANTATTINGITVPPAPDPTINATTLAGVDSNSNGVRDDAEIMIASFSKKDTYESSTFQMAKIEQRLATEAIVSQSEYNALNNQSMCLDQNRSSEEKQIMSQNDIKVAIVNTKERSAKYYENEIKYAAAWSATGRVACN